MTDKVTVYVTNYNYGQYLEKAIESVLSQSYPNIEVLIFDDGSSDDSHSILDRYETHDAITVVRKQNEGLNATIIQAFQMAAGEYVIRLDADDWFDPRIIELLVAEMKADDDVALVFPDYYEVDEHGNVMHQIRRHDFKDGVTILDQPAHGACALVRKRHYCDVGGHSHDYSCQDGVDLWLALTHKYKVANVNEPLFYYRKHGNSLSSNERRILSTRFNIYADHARARGFQSQPTLAVIPMRKRLVGGKDFGLLEVAGKKLVDWALEKAYCSCEIDRIVVVSEAEDVLAYVANCAAQAPKPLTVSRRAPELASAGADIAETVLHLLAHEPFLAIDTVVVLTVDTPFSLVNYVDTAIYSMYLYGSECVDSVQLDNGIFYYHDGSGLKLWQDIKVRRERENVYVRRGGISVIKRAALERARSMITEPMGHVIIDDLSSFVVKTHEDLLIADFIGRKLLGNDHGA